MPVCKTCNSTIPENCRYCGYCGAEILPETDPEEERSCLHHLRRNLRHERVAWRAYGILYLIAGILIHLSAFLLLIVALTDPLFLFNAVTYYLMSLVYIAIAIVSLILSKKAWNYSEQVPTNCEAAVQRAGRVGTIVLGAIFNQIALAFIIVNFIHVRTHKDLLDRIIEKQKNA